MEEKIKEILKFSKEIKAKMETICSSNKTIKRFNHKLEALLVSFDAYTIEKSNIIPETPKKVKKIKRKKSDEVKKIEVTEDPNIEVNVSTRESEGLLELIQRMERVVPDNRLFKMNAKKVIETLFENSDGLFLEEIMKNSGVSKYRCVDILNALVKADPPIIVKKFDKKFIYSLNLL